jgi:hypothetical protein
LLNVIAFSNVDLIERGAASFPTTMPLWNPKTVGKQRRTAGRVAVFRHSTAWGSRNSAENERPLTDNFMPKQQKQREVPRRESAAGGAAANL